MHFSRDRGAGAVLESSLTPCKLRFCARCFLALTKKLLFLEAPIVFREDLWVDRSGGANGDLGLVRVSIMKSAGVCTGV
ncbi:MAG: hypothetical protein MAG794_01128 [Gammaproteobacteria bacterium]|nr:hypothetical protein [Gammaproteobacteria bacterium]